MYDIKVRKLAIRLVNNVGVCRARAFTSISRVTLWRWKRFGIDRKRRHYESKLYEACKDALVAFLTAKPTSTSFDASRFLRDTRGTYVSPKTVRKFIKRAGFSRKRTRLRGTTKKDVESLKSSFREKYRQALDEWRVFVSVDECGFSERIKPLYGYSPVGEPVIVKTQGGWKHLSLLMAVFSDGRVAHRMINGAVNAASFQQFISSIDSTGCVLVLDNASIHKKVQVPEPTTILFTPPYTPEFNAIELCFATIKGKFRRMNVDIDSGTNTESIVQHCVDALGAETIVRCFRHTAQEIFR